MEKRVILEKVYPTEDKSQKKSEIVEWSEALRRFNLSTDELKDIIENGKMITHSNVNYYLDEALSF